MRMLLLTARPELEVNRRLEVAARSLGVDAVTVDATQVTSQVGPQPRLRLGARDLLEPSPGAVLARVGNWRPDSVLAALEVAVRCGAATPNPPAAVRTGRDHWRTISELAAAGVPVPVTLAGADPEHLAESAEQALGFPVVVKQRRSRMGVGVIRCASRDHLEAVLDSLWRLGDEVVVQSMVETGGQSLRLLVVGGEVVAAARLCAPAGEWRSNAARGGTAERCRPTPSQVELACSAAGVLGLGVCGVDLLPGRSTVVGEVNPSPGFLHLEAATGVDVARAIVGFAVACASRA